MLTQDQVLFVLNGLTPRQAQIAVQVISGKSNKEIADNLFIELQTVKFHVTNIYKKLDVKNRVGLSRWFYIQRDGM